MLNCFNFLITKLGAELEAIEVAKLFNTKPILGAKATKSRVQNIYVAIFAATVKKCSESVLNRLTKNPFKIWICRRQTPLF